MILNEFVIFLVSFFPWPWTGWLVPSRTEWLPNTKQSLDTWCCTWIYILSATPLLVWKYLAFKYFLWLYLYYIIYILSATPLLVWQHLAFNYYLWLYLFIFFMIIFIYIFYDYTYLYFLWLYLYYIIYII